jgi:hypothetical protein
VIAITTVFSEEWTPVCDGNLREMRESETDHDRFNLFDGARGQRVVHNAISGDRKHVFDPNSPEAPELG